MHNYEYILIDSSKRSNGTACDFSYELNRPVRDITKLELVYSSLSNTILTFTDRDYFYFQEEGNPYTPPITNNKIYIQQPSLTFTGYNFGYGEETTTIVSGDRVFKFYEIAEDEITKIYHSFIITETEFNLPINEFAAFLQSKFREIGSFDYNVSYDYSFDDFRIKIGTHGYLGIISKFGLDFDEDLDIHLKIGFLKMKYEPNDDFISTNSTIENPEVISRVERNVLIPAGNYSFNEFIDKLQELLNNVAASSFSYRVGFIYDLLSIEVIQDETNKIKKFRLPGSVNPNFEQLGFTNPFTTPYEIRHIAAKVMEGTTYTITLDNIQYYPSTLSLEIQDKLRVINSNYTVEILDEITMKIINNDTKFKIINNTDSLPFIFSNDELSHLQISDASTVFQGEDSIKNIQFDNGSYTSDDILEFLKLKLNSEGRSGYDATISLSNFKINISNETKKFKLFFSKDDSVWKRFGFKNENTEYKNEHISDYTASLESSDYILVQIRGVATPITNKKTSGCFFIPIISTRYEVQTINSNQSFTQLIYTGNLDLSTLDIKLLNDEGDVLESEELNLKMLIKCYK